MAYRPALHTLKPEENDVLARLQLPAILALAAEYDLQAAAADLQAFRDLYHDIPILPPDQYNSLVLLASDGCRYNKCTFCNFYRDVPYRPRSLQQFQQHVDAAADYYGPALAARRRFSWGRRMLCSVRAVAEEILRYVNDRFELPPPGGGRQPPEWWRGKASRFTGITSFLDAFVGARLEADEFASLRQLNLRQIFIGMGRAPLSCSSGYASQPVRRRCGKRFRQPKRVAWQLV